MPRGQVKVEFVGLLPTFFTTCSPCCSKDYVKICVLDYRAEQVREYPPKVVKAQERVSELYTRLMRDFGDRIIPIAVGLTSLRGVWLSLRHRLGRDLALVIDGRKVVSGKADYEVIKKTIEEVLKWEMH